MAVTATTTLGATGYTPKASFSKRAHLNSSVMDGDPLKIKPGPDSSTTIAYHNVLESSYSNKYFDVREIINYNYSGVIKWCREWFSNQTAFCGYQKSNGQKYVVLPNGNPSCTYGQIRVTSGTITASRDYNSSKTVTVKATLNYQITQAPIESYYNWQVYVYLERPNSLGELKQYIYNRSKSWKTGTGSKTFSYSFEDTSGKTSLSSGNYGIWGNGNGVKYNMNPSMGVGKAFSINIPQYIPSPIRRYNGSSWVTVSIRNGTGNKDLQVKRYNGSSWVNL